MRSSVAATLLVGLLGGGCDEARPAPPPAPEPAQAPEAPTAPLPEAPKDGPRVVLLGTGTPVPDPKRSGPATAIVHAGRAYLVDAGPGVVRRAAAAHRDGVAELDASRLSRVFVTHLHSDHTVGLADLMFTPPAVGRREPLWLYGPPGLAEMTEHLRKAYRQDLAVRGAGKPPNAMVGYGAQAREVEPGVVLDQDGVRVTAFRVPHGSFPHAFGYRFDAGGRSMVVSGDTAASDAVVEACAGCDVLVHEVFCEASVGRGPQGFQGYHRTFHTSGAELGALATRAKPKLLVLSHLLLFGCSESQLLEEVRSTYAGEVVVGEDLGVY